MNSFFNSRNYFQKKGHKILFSSLKKFKPEIILLGHVNLSDEIIKNIKDICPDAKILAWYVDPPEMHRLERYKKLEEYIDILFMTTGGETLKKLKSNFKKIPKFAFFPNPTDESMDFYRSFDNDRYEYDVMYCGSDSRYKNRSSFLEKVIELTPSLRWFVAGSLGKPKVYGAKYYNILASTQFGINISKFSPNEFHLYSSDRISQLTGNGVLNFNQTFPGISKLFNSNEIIKFRDADDLASLLNYYHANQDEARKIAKAGFERAHRSYSAKRITKYLLESISENFSEDYEWMEEVYK